MNIEANKTVDLREHRNDPETRELVLESRRALLRTLGFSANFIQKLEEEKPVLYTKENIDAKIEGLKERGFKDPIKMISKFPAVLCYALSSIDAKIEGLKERGFKDPVKMITKFPPVFGRALSSIDAKIEGLKERGFKDPVKMITKFPSLIGLAFTNIDEKIEGLKERGFKDPVKMITKFPVLLSLAFTNIDEKIEGLKERGFKDPVKMITTLPVLLGLAFSNIDRKLIMLRRLVTHFHLNLDPIETIEKFPAFVSYKIDKLWTTARIIAEKAQDIDEVTSSAITALIRTNLEELMLAARYEADLGLGKVGSVAKKVGKQQVPKTEKRARIDDLPDDDKLKKRYFRGYPMKAA